MNRRTLRALILLLPVVFTTGCFFAKIGGTTSPSGGETVSLQETTGEKHDNSAGNGSSVQGTTGQSAASPVFSEEELTEEYIVEMFETAGEELPVISAEQEEVLAVTPAQTAVPTVTPVPVPAAVPTTEPVVPEASPVMEEEPFAEETDGYTPGENELPVISD